MKNGGWNNQVWRCGAGRRPRLKRSRSKGGGNVGEAVAPSSAVGNFRGNGGGGLVKG